MLIEALTNIEKAVTAMHGCRCSYETTTFVNQIMDGRTIWQGAVETFWLEGHPKATKAFTWGYRHARDIRYIAVLNVPPINSPSEAVLAAIASGTQR